jgi:hypothetical protein
MPVILPTITPDYTGFPRAHYKVVEALSNLGQFTNALEGKLNGLTTQVTTPALAPPLTAAQLKQVQAALGATGGMPLNVTNLPGAGGTNLLVGTHAQRLATTPTTGETYYETDRHALYAAETGVWVLIGSCPEMECTGVGALPADLGTNDAAFYAFDTTTGLLYLWDGAVWHWHKGIQYGLYANRPVAFSGCDAGVIYVATDYGYQAWYLNYATSAWTLIEGWGQPLGGALSAIPTLTANDFGFRYAATDYNRQYIWTGSAWQDYVGEPTRGQIAFFPSAFTPPSWWALCNGANANFSTSTGGISSVATPNLVGQFVLANNSSGGTGSAVAISYQTGSTVLNAVNYTSELVYIRL